MIKKNVPIAIIAIGLGLVAFSFMFVEQKQIENTYSFTNTATTSPEVPIASTTQKIKGSNPPSQTQPAASEKIISPEVKTITISIAVRGATSTLQVPEESSVYDAMNIRTKTKGFSFHSTYYSGMGYFIDEINGEKNRNNAFWVYYVNGAQANVGAGAYILKNGDTIVWRLEDSAKKEVGIQ